MALAALESERTVAAGFRFPVWGSVVLALLAALATTYSIATQVWSVGAFFDTDDAMRAVQVRDLLAGQAWFDMTAYRLDPPRGVFSHWSRVVDVPLAAMELFFRLFLTPGDAEIITRLLFPLGLLGALFALSPWFARVLAANASPHLAVLLALLSGANFAQFLPGRIDHHAPQIVLLMVSLGLYLQALDEGQERRMVGSAVALAASLAISLENLPFFAIMLASAPLLFVVDGARRRPTLAWLALGLSIAAPIFYLLTVGPSRYFVVACDAYSSPYLAGILAGAAGMGILALSAPVLENWRRRAAAVGVVGAGASAVFIVLAPQCLGDPLGGIDPLARELWLSHVTEARALWTFWHNRPTVVLITAYPILLSVLTTLMQGWWSYGDARRRWLITGGIIALGGLAGMFWQVRIFTSVTPLAMATLCVPVLAVAERLTQSLTPLSRALMAGVLCLAVSPVGLGCFAPASAMGATPEEAAASDVTEKKPDVSDCRKAEVLRRFGAAFDKGRVAAAFDLGPHVLAFTSLSTLAGPYHRDNHGNRIVIDAFLADPSAAEKILREAGADIVLWCKAETAPFAQRAPEGLAARLARGDTPAWLNPISIEGIEPLQAFTIR